MMNAMYAFAVSDIPTFQSCRCPHYLGESVLSLNADGFEKRLVRAPDDRASPYHREAAGSIRAPNDRRSPNGSSAVDHDGAAPDDGTAPDDRAAPDRIRRKDNGRAPRARIVNGGGRYCRTTPDVGI